MRRGGIVLLLVMMTRMQIGHCQGIGARAPSDSVSLRIVNADLRSAVLIIQQ